MCRIYGYFNATVPPDELMDVAASQRHGGPDGMGLLHGPGWGLGTNRLATVDLHGGAQPYDLDGQITAVFDGEIYNHDALRSRLIRLGYQIADRRPGGIIPALYREYGESFLEMLDGMYAVAVLDRRGRPKLLLATDEIGAKPLYYRWDPATRSLHFSSELPALFGFRAVGRTLWEPGLDSYLASKAPFGTQTMFEEIEVLPPATTMRCTLGDTPRFTRRLRPVPATAPTVTAIAERLRAEVSRLLVADVPVCVITSGGLDSGLVTSFAGEHGPVHSFNIAYRGSWPFDERHYARKVAEHAGTVHHQIEVDPADFPALIEKTVGHLGQPNADPITLSTYALFTAVRDAGFKVALTGDAGDELFGGYARMRAALADVASGADWYSRYLDRLAVLPARRRRSLYTDAYRRFVEDIPAIPVAALDRLRDGAGTVLRRITEFEIDYRLPAYHLRRVDHLSMARSVQVRLPFGQRGVVDLGRALTDELRIRDGKVKWALHAAAAGLLPDEVLRREKQPFTLPVTAMLAPGTPLWEFARDALAPDRLRAAGQLAPRAVEDLFATQAARPDDTTALTIWALMIHEVWRERHGAPLPVGVVAA